MFLGLVLVTFYPACASSQSCSATWTGNAGNGSWSTAGNWSPRKVPGSTSDVCIPTFTTANGAGLDGSSSSISVHSIQVAQGGSLLFGSGKVSISTSLLNQGFITLYGTTLSAGSIDMPNPGDIDSYDNSSITSPAFSNSTGTLYVGPGGHRLRRKAEGGGGDSLFHDEVGCPE